MKYVSASDILPEQLLQEIQKYVQGRTIYIPSPEDGRKKWGQLSGQRDYLRKRNLEIRQSFRKGNGVEQLSQSYCLAEETIRKIVYQKN
ncbi:CD3324 family protein [Paenibacillus cellulositrophicus]|uniref:CD3324 family protein n=1 Tax=Paenibacillus cellulositrophicus TaxID=562959 RepID=UPI0012677616|nr:CD3324 family protein [Paenibacillus cellulositrophicus]